MAAFLQQRRGFCQHFAATMAMMARTLGIPSRVVVGFLQPDRTTGPSSYVFTSQDVHSWPELYFQGVGWVRFEPTQGVGAPFPQWADANSGPTSQPSVTVPTSPGVVSATKQQRPTAAPTQVAGTTGGPGGGSNGSVPSKAWLIPLAALAVALVPALIRLAVRRNRLGGPVDAAAAAEAAWLELRDSVRDLRLPWSGSMTPRARERSIAPLVGSDSEARTALQRLAKCVEQARYATTVFEGNEPAADASTVMAAISRRTDGARRLRAVLWPASLLPDARAAWSRVRRSAP
jgi:hypothetical protein